MLEKLWNLGYCKSVDEAWNIEYFISSRVPRFSATAKLASAQAEREARALSCRPDVSSVNLQIITLVTLTLTSPTVDHLLYTLSTPHNIDNWFGIYITSSRPAFTAAGSTD